MANTKYICHLNEQRVQLLHTVPLTFTLG